MDKANDINVLCRDDPYGAMMRTKIMIIDDDDRIRKLLCGFLEHAGFSVSCQASGAEALLEIQHGDFDYIVTDFEMPEMDGLEVTRQVRRILPRAIVIGMSGGDRGMAFLNAGANDFLQKPFALERLAGMVSGARMRDPV